MSSHFTLSVLTKAEKNQDGSFVFPFSANTVTFLFFYGGREFWLRPYLIFSLKTRKKADYRQSRSGRKTFLKIIYPDKFQKKNEKISKIIRLGYLHLCKMML